MERSSRREWSQHDPFFFSIEWNEMAINLKLRNNDRES